MEKGLRYLVEAATAIKDDPTLSIEATAAGVRCKCTWQHLHPGNPPKPGKFYTLENLTPWRALHQSRTNPLTAALDMLVRERTEFVPDDTDA